MSGIAVFTIIVLFSVIGILIVYNMNINKKIKTFSSINQKITSLNVLQNFMDILGADVSADEKIRNLNDTIIEKYDIKYSTIVTFDGNKYSISATNVDERYSDVLSNLHTNDEFQESIATATTKYITVTSASQKLSYQINDVGRCKSAMFFPMYMDNVYIGYWIIESEKPKAFDNIDTSILEVVKENIVKIIKGVEYQSVIEETVRIDEFSGLFSVEYLYGEGRKILNKHATSTICMFNIVNIKDINKTSREFGNRIITEISNKIKENISNEYIFIRYLGPKFIIAFGGTDVDAVKNYMKDIKEEIEEEVVIEVEEDKKLKKAKQTINPILNFALTTYYKGTPLEGTAKKLEEYFLSTAEPDESSINII